MHYILQLLFPHHLQWQNIYLASPLCWFYVFIHLDHTTTLQNTLKTYFPIRERLRWYNWRNTQQGSSGYLNDSDGVTNMGGSLGPPSEGSPTVGADLDDLFVSWGPIAWGIILERDVGRLDVSWYHDKTKNLIPRKPHIKFSFFGQAIIHRPVGALLTEDIHKSYAHKGAMYSKEAYAKRVRLFLFPFYNIRNSKFWAGVITIRTEQETHAPPPPSSPPHSKKSAFAMKKESAGKSTIKQKANRERK